MPAVAAIPAAPAAPAAAGGSDALCASARKAAEAQQDSLLARARSSDVLLLGEVHTSAADHAWQLQTLQALARQGSPLALGLEMLPAARQGLLDRYSAGALSDDAFLQQVGWAEVWGHDPQLYLPLLRWARSQAIPLLALNVEPAVVRRVRRQGLAAVGPEAREGLGIPAPADAAYRERLRQAWLAHRSPGVIGHPDRAAESTDLERFIESQLLRDRAMAERLAAAHRRDPQRRLVALIGRGHLQDGSGVPTQLRDLGLQRLLVAERPPLPPRCAPAPARARLGAYLESNADGVWVQQVAPGSAAAAGGLRPGDRLLTVNGQAVQRAGEVIQRVRQHPEAEPLRLTIKRSGRSLTLQLRLPPPAPALIPRGD